MALNIPFRNAYYRFASSYSFLFFISWSLWWSLYAIWLKGHLGLTGTELGTLYSVNQFTSILFMMFYGIVQDKLGLKKPLIWCMSFILVLTGPFMIYVYEPLLQSNFSVGLILGALFFGLGYLAGCGLLDSFTEKMARNFHFEYGTARAWGSFGYAIGAFFAGIFFSISPHINFWLVSLFGAVFMMINMRFKDKDHQCVAADAGGVKKEDFIAVFKDRNFWVFVIFIVGTWSFYNIFDQQLFPVFYSGLTAIISALVICIIVCLSWAVNHYRDNAIAYKEQRDKKVSELKQATATITDMQQRQRAADVLDAKYTKELANAKAENDALRRKLDNGGRVLVKGKCSVPSAAETSSASGMGNDATVELSPVAGRNVLGIRDGIIRDQTALRTLQEYIRTQCLR